MSKVEFQMQHFGNLFVTMDTSSPATSTTIFSVHVPGGADEITCTVSSGGTTCSENTTFVNRGAARIVLGPEELEDLFLMKDERSLEKMGQNAKNLLSSHQGATARTLQVIESRMNDSQG